MYDVIVIGAGPAGLAAALSAKEHGADSILIIERENELGGILNQCIHNGFGLHFFGEDLTGPEYAHRFVQQLVRQKIEIKPDTMVLEITPDKDIICISASEGLERLQTKAIVMAMGCRERTRGAIAIPGDRSSGVMTAGTAQRYINLEGYMVGKRVVILGSGDVGLIMARRMTLEGAKVLACVEICPYSNGLNRNIVQCLEDFEIPLYLSHTITQIGGLTRVEHVVISQVDADKKPLRGTEQTLDCDTVLLSLGLIPENELSQKAGIPLDPRTGGAQVSDDMQTKIPGIFACGNAVHVHDLADDVTREGTKAGAGAAAFAKTKYSSGQIIPLRSGEHIAYTVPQSIRLPVQTAAIEICFRVEGIRGPCQIKLESEGKTKFSLHKKWVTPGEMEQIRIPGKLIDQTCDSLMMTLTEG